MFLKRFAKKNTHTTAFNSHLARSFRSLDFPSADP